MSDIDGAQAPAESASASPELPLDTPNPISTEDQGQPDKPEAKTEPKAKAESKPLSTREALEKAAAKVEKDNKPVEAKAAEKPADKPAEVKSDKPRDETTGKFTAKEGDKTAEVKAAQPVDPAKPSHTAGEAPARFTETAKAKWAVADPEIRGEVSRMERELTQGYEKHRVAAERDATLNEFHDMAKQSGKELHGVVREYVNMEQTLRKDLVGGLDTICQRMGVSLRDVAAHVLGQTPDQNASKQDETIRNLNAKIDQLQQQVGSVSQNFQHQQATAVGREVADFAAAHSRFEELHEDIAFFLKTRTQDLSEAYKLAERLNPAPAGDSTTGTAKAPVIDLTAQTEKGQKSINGAPGAGSSQTSSKPSNSIKESLRKAMAAAG